MTTPILFYTNMCCGTFPKPGKEPSCAPENRVPLAAIVTDLVILLILCCVTAYFSMPWHYSPVASYAAAGGALGVVGLWIAMVIQVKCDKENKLAERLRES